MDDKWDWMMQFYVTMDDHMQVNDEILCDNSKLSIFFKKNYIKYFVFEESMFKNI